MSEGMDKSWISQPRNSKSYIKGVCDFMEFAKQGAQNGKIRCPCNVCQLDRKKILTLEEVEMHILFKGFYKEYNDWIFHGPSTLAENVAKQMGHMIEIPDHLNLTCQSQDDIAGLLRDVIGYNVPCTEEIRFENNEQPEIDNLPNESHDEEPNLFSSEEESMYKKILEASSKELYEGCTTFSKLSFLLHLFHIKCMFKWPDKSFSMLIGLLLDAFPQVTDFPSSYYQAKKLIMDLGLGYEKIHACPNDCMLYWGEKSSENYCHSCLTSRWKNDKMSIPAKVMTYFPLVPRLKRMYMSSKIAEDMRWHDKDRKKDGFLRHPADAAAWRDFDARYPEFASDPRSVRLGLASDGFNPYRLMNSTYSTWPVILIPYNLPPWLCMKPSSFILSMIIPGRNGPGNNIDVYMQPLIHELKLLWEGVDAFDSYARENFKMQAALMWTINDLPAYAMLSGWSTKGYNACPVCAHLTPSVRVGNKICYIGHRKWLPHDHPFRFRGDLFDGSEEHGDAPSLMSGSDIVREQAKIGKLHKAPRKRRRHLGDIMISEVDINEDKVLWTKRSIFFDLPYWKHNLLRHNLDVMHIEKNVCDNLLMTLMNVDGKTKDDEKARLFLEERNVKPHLWLESQGEGESVMPPAPYCMSSEDKRLFLNVLQNLRAPDGYGSNLSRCVNMKNKRLVNLKSHDNHILMQDVLPVALKASQTSQVGDLLDDLSSFFRSICSKIIDPKHVDALQSNITDILCRMEIEFLPPFFTIMVHLLIHLVKEIEVGGPVHYRWMYPIERYLAHLKTYVRNKAQPDGSIVEGYILEETITFCSRYLEGVETIFNRPHRNDDDNPQRERYLLESGGRPIGEGKIIRVPDRSLAQIQRYVLTQFEELIKPFYDEFIYQKRNENSGIRIDDSLVSKWKADEFSDWFKSQVSKIDGSTDEGRLTRALACGPTSFATKVKGYVINGIKFNTTTHEKTRKTQNSGVMVLADGEKYYGRLTEILELDYSGTYRVVIFRCDWVDLTNGINLDGGYRPRVNFSKLIHTGRFLRDEPFVISSQARQVFYVADEKEKGWHYVIESKPRDLYDLGDD